MSLSKQLKKIALTLCLLLFVGGDTLAASPDPTAKISIDGGCAQTNSAALAKNVKLVTAAITYCEGGDAYKGTVSIRGRLTDLKHLDIYSSGHPDGNSVSFWLADSQGHKIGIVPAEQGDYWSLLNIDTPKSWKGDREVTLSGIDKSSDWSKWLGLGFKPKSTLYFPIKNYLVFFLKLALIVALIFLPGTWLFSTKKNLCSAAWIPVPGITVLAIFGLIEWTIGSTGGRYIRYTEIAFYAILAADLIRRLLMTKAWHAKKSGLPDGLLWCASVFTLVLMQASAYGINPLPVAQEIGRGGPLPGRMIASPPDHAIPYQTARYMFNHFNGIEQNKDYFGEWNITSRGPLVPLGITALFELFKLPSDVQSTSYRQEIWPLSTSGEDLARMYGWVLNSLVVFGAWHLLSTLKAPRRSIAVAVAWIALCPGTSSEVVYLWPKFLACYFVLIALSSALARKPALSGLAMAFAWLSHPVGALFIPPVGLFAIACNDDFSFTASRIARQFKNGLHFTLGVVAMMSPWLIYKLHLGYHDAFEVYVLGDGHGFTKTPNIWSWLGCRASNFWLTLSPAAFYYSHYMESWLDGPLSAPLRWAIQYCKTLPGNLGFSAFILAYLSLIRPQPNNSLKSLRNLFLIPGFLLMLIFWGYSPDGLGRNALEPIALVLICLASANFTWRKWPIVVLAAVAAESLWMEITGFFFAKGFDPASVKADSWSLILFSILVSATILWLANRRIRMEGTNKFGLNLACSTTIA